MTESSPEPFSGTKRFVVENCLGEGGFGVVYRAYDREREALVALKVLRRADATALYRFKREFRMLADLSHPNLVTLYELLSDGEHWFFTMELVEGSSFLDYVHEGARRSPNFTDWSTPTAVREEASVARTERPPGRPIQGGAALSRLRTALGQLAEGVRALHEAGILHRDIKPSNVLVNKDGRVVLLDFGLVLDIKLDAATQAGFVGTPAYMSPEQALQQGVSEASDWYSVGVILYEALTGRLPFDGRLLGALAVNRTAEARPPHEWATETPEDLDVLCRDLLRSRPEHRPIGGVVLRCLRGGAEIESRGTVEAFSPMAAAPFVGREEQLEALEESLAAVNQGKMVTVYVHGTSGIGKTVLVRRFLQQIRERQQNAVVLEGRCYQQESVPYKALDSLVDNLSQYLKHLPGSDVETMLPPDILALARLFPVLRQVDAVARAQQKVLRIQDSQELRRRAFRALRELLARLSDRSSVILFIDDLQWGDIDSAELLGDLLRPPDPPALLAIGCYRSEEVESSPALGQLLAQRIEGPNAEVLELKVEELALEESRALTLELMGGSRSPSEARADAIARDSGGSPFFITELVLYSLSDRGFVRSLDSSGVPADVGPVEATVDAVILDRVSTLSRDARRLLEVLSVVGRPLEISMARQVAGLTVGELDAISVLRAQHLIRIRGTEEDQEIETYHDRIRETVLENLAAETLRSHHHQLALALEASNRSDLETLATHFYGAGNLERAARYAAEAAAEAVDALAFDRAARLYQIALDFRPERDVRRQYLLVRLADALANAGRGAEAAKKYLAAAEKANASETVELRRRAGEQLLVSGRIDEGLEVLDDVMSSVGVRLAKTPYRALVSLIFRRGYARLVGLGFRSRDEFEVPAEELLRIDTMYSIVVGLGVVEPIQAAAFAERHLLFARKAGEPYRVARAICFKVPHIATAGAHTHSQTQRFIHTAREIAERVNDPRALGTTELVDGIAAFLQGRWRDARERLESAEEILREQCKDVTWERAACYIFMLRSLLQLGDLNNLFSRYRLLSKEAEQRGDLFVGSFLGTDISGLVHLAADDPGRALQAVKESIEGGRAEGAHRQKRFAVLLHHWGLLTQTEIDLYRGSAEGAWKTIRNGWPDLRRSLVLLVQYARLRSYYTRACCTLAVAAETGGEIQRSTLKAASRDARRMVREGTVWGSSLSRLVAGSIAATEGRAEEARVHLGEAERGFESCDMAFHGAVARRRRGQLLGGEEGRALVQAADAWMTDRSIRSPARMADMLCPGRWS